MPTAPDNRVVVGLSGGVDSSVAALLLKRDGYDVHGLFMNNWEEDDTGYCTNARDFQDARAVCERLEIPLHRVSFAREYRERVFEYLLSEYRAGRTPNPDVLCNREIKFGEFARYARRLGAAWIATGHYARVDAERRLLLRARDEGKDQTYFLHGIHGPELARVKFPLGDLMKREVRRIAADAGLPTHAKQDSTGICFIGERPFREFLSGHLPGRPGPIVTETGERIGTHEGLVYYTIGQRQGLGIGGVRGRDDAPWYVAEKRLETGELVVVQGGEHPRLFAPALLAVAPSWIAGEAPGWPLRCRARLRHRQLLQDCLVQPVDDNLLVSFDQPQRAIAPGQFAVLYAGEACLGGAVIQRALPAPERLAEAVEAPLTLV
jgi:tRNA-specific 2-thiouridylase